MQSYAVSVAEVADMGTVPGPEVFWMQQFGVRLPLKIHVVLIRGQGHTILVNAGPPEDYLGHMNTAWREELGEGVHISVPQVGAMRQALAAWGIHPEDVDYVVVTPIQAYAIGGIDLFPNAKIGISRTGWIDLFAPRHHDPRRHMAVPDRLLSYLLFDLWPQQRVDLLENEDEIAPGVRTWWAGTHHRSSLTVEVDTKEGVVAISDVAFYYQNLERNIPLGILESLEECRDAYQRLRQSAKFVSLYDPTTLQRYPAGVVVRSE